MDSPKNRRNLYLVYMGIFGVIFLLNCLTHRAIGDDYLYSFVWEGHSMYEPLSENARRISSFSDIAESTYSYFMTWGGRIVAQSLAMFFLWMPRIVFNVCIAGATVFLVILIQWMARGGRVTMDLSAREAALIFFCIWTFQANFVGVFIWLDGSCNYLFPMLALLLFLLPYVRHYMSEGKQKESTWLVYVMFLLGVLAGNSNENTICWIGLFGFFYLLLAYRKRMLKWWMVTGFVGLTIGYGLLVLAPGNFLRMAESHETVESLKINSIKLLFAWFNTLLQSMLVFYIWKAFRKRKYLLAIEEGKKYFHLSLWMLIFSYLFVFIMLFSPEFPTRSLFPSLIFSTSSVFIMVFLAKNAQVDILNPKLLGLNYSLALIYFMGTFSMTTYWFIQEYQYESKILEETKLLEGTGEVLLITEQPPNDDLLWIYLTGLHKYGYSMSTNDNDWRNVAYARFHHIKGVRLVKE